MSCSDARRRVGFVAAVALLLLVMLPTAQGEDVGSGETPVPSTPGSTADLRPVPVPVPAPSAEALRYHRTGNWLWLLNQVWSLLVPAVLLFGGISSRLRDASRRVGRVWFFTVGIYSLLFTVIVATIDLPLAYYQGFVRQHAYGLSNQSLGRWFNNELKGLAIGLVAGFLFLWIPYLLLRLSPRRWWLYATLLSVPFSLLVMLIAPIWIDPLFNDFGPMKDRTLERKILALAERSGIAGSRIFEVNKSVDSKAMNAYVKGFRTTKRIVLYDTLIARLDEREVLAVMAHEMGHYALGHVTRTILLSSLIVLLSLWTVDRAGTWLALKYAGRFGFERISDVASLPLLAILLQLTTLGLSPVIMAYSRAQEHEADTFALELTRDNHAVASAFAKLQQENLGVPWHSTFEKLWRSTHPSIGERIEFCNEYRPWAEGRPLQYGDYFRP